MTIIDSLRSRVRPEWEQSDPALHSMILDVLRLSSAPQLKRADIENAGTLNARGVSEEM
jgi:hypothetical protein